IGPARRLPAPERVDPQPDRGRARKHGLRNCEARAINAAIRECGCGIKEKYSRQELEKPFAVVRVAFLPDMTDPDIKRMVTERALGGTTALYALPPTALPSDGPSGAAPRTRTTVIYAQAMVNPVVRSVNRATALYLEALFRQPL